MRLAHTARDPCANVHRSRAEGHAGGPMGAAMPGRQARPARPLRVRGGLVRGGAAAPARLTPPGSAGCRRNPEKLKSREPASPPPDMGAAE